MEQQKQGTCDSSNSDGGLSISSSSRGSRSSRGRQAAAAAAEAVTATAAAVIIVCRNDSRHGRDRGSRQVMSCCAF